MTPIHWDPAIFDQAFQFMGLLDLEGRLLAANRSALAFIDLPQEAVVGHLFWETPWWAHSPEAQETVRAAVAEARRGHRFCQEVTHSGARGERIVVDFSMTPIRDASGSIAWLLPEGRDITCFASQREALAQEESKLRTIFMRSMDGMLLLDGDTFTMCNPAVLAMMRCTEPEFLRMHPWDLSPPTQPDGSPSEQKALEMIRLGYEKGGHRFEWIHRRVDGTDFPVEVTLIPIPLEGREVLYTTWRDITARKASEASLVASEERFRRVAELTGQAIYDRHLATGETVWAGAVQELTGSPSASFSSGGPEAWWSRIHPEDQKAVQEAMWKAQEAHAPFELEYRFLHSDGTYRRFADRGTIVTTAQGIRRSLGAVSDITRLRASEAERLEMERRMLHSQKLESLGILAGGIAHDFNNLLTAILGHLNLAHERLADDSELLPHWDGMALAIQKASQLTRQMLAYSGRGRIRVEPHDLNQTITEIRSLLAASISKKIQVELELSSDLPPIESDVAQIQQVVLNLVTNAADAIGDGEGRIRLRTALVTLDAAGIAADYSAWPVVPGVHVQLEVSDTGCGMAPEVLARIFDPFFTTKAAGRGLGLSAILGILKRHGAGMRVTSAPGRGTTFVLCFRPCEGLPLPHPEASPNPSKLQGRVLLVDDEEAILETSRLALSSIGLDIVLARDGLEAVQQVEACPDLSLVLLDLTMPKMDGREALTLIRQRRPTLTVVLCSGFSTQQAPSDAEEGVAFLPKPYTIRELRQTVRKAIQGQ